MKRIYIPFLMILLSLSAQAQTESLSIQADGAQRKDFGGYILDMATMLNTESLEVDMPFRLDPHTLTPIYHLEMEPQIRPEAFKIDTQIIYSVINSPTFPHSGLLAHPGVASGSFQWQSVTRKLNNGMRFTTYGEYDADGRRVQNPQAMPWQKQNFNAGFMQESEDGKFGIGIEVHRGRNNPF